MLETKKHQYNRDTINSEDVKEEKIVDDNKSEQSIYTDLIKIDKIIDEYNAEKGFLVSILQDLQEETGFLTPEGLIHISNRLDIPVIQVYRVAKFYDYFRLESLNKTVDKNRNLESSVRKDYLSKFSK